MHILTVFSVLHQHNREKEINNTQFSRFWSSFRLSNVIFHRYRMVSNAQIYMANGLNPSLFFCDEIKASSCEIVFDDYP